MSDTFDIQELYAHFTSSEAVKEGTARGTIPAGTYVVTIKKAEPRIAGERSPWPGRKTISLQLSAERDGAVKGTLFQDVSPFDMDQFRTKSGRLDGVAQLWTHLKKALDPEGAADDGVIFEQLTRFPLEAYIQETFDCGADGDGKTIYKNAVGEEERKKYFEQGFVARNRVASFRRLK